MYKLFVSCFSINIYYHTICELYGTLAGFAQIKQGKSIMLGILYIKGHDSYNAFLYLINVTK
jgi:hypothetical protein